MLRTTFPAPSTGGFAPLAAAEMPEWLSFLPDDWSIRTLFLGCAALGAVVLIAQLVLLAFGMGDADVDVEMELEGGGDGAGILSIRAVAAFFAFFGLTGMATLAAGMSTPLSVLSATGAGLVSFFLLAWLIQLQTKLTQVGNLEPEQAVGMHARVYLRVPGARAGKGKITVQLQGREEQFEATTAGDELSTGTEVRIIAMTSPGIFDVEQLHGPDVSHANA